MRVSRHLAGAQGHLLDARLLPRGKRDSGVESQMDRGAATQVRNGKCRLPVAAIARPNQLKQGKVLGNIKKGAVAKFQSREAKVPADNRISPR